MTVSSLKTSVRGASIRRGGGSQGTGTCGEESGNFGQDGGVAWLGLVTYHLAAGRTLECRDKGGVGDPGTVAHP